MKPIIMLMFLLWCMNAGAQETRGNISMKITDDENRSIPDVSIRLLHAADSSLAKIGLTDTAGNAAIEEIKPGDYFVELSAFGFENYRSAALTIDSLHHLVQLPQVKMTKSENNLREVTVVNKKPFIERHLDKLVLNVENSIAAMGSSVLEVLERAPGVIISNGNAINLKGKQGVIVMIDGKISPLSGEDLINYLRSMPSANVDRIEIITNPSAKYDAAGNAGIINIRFKKDQRQGFNGSASLSMGQGMYNKPSGSTNLNFRKKKWNLFGNYAYGQPTGFTRFYINRKFFNSNQAVESVFDQDSFIKQNFKNHHGKAGVDYYISPKTVIGVLFYTSMTDQRKNGFTDSKITNSEGATQYTSGTQNILDESGMNAFGNFNFKHTFDSTGKELTFDADYGQYASDAKQRFVSSFYDALGLPTTENTLKTNQSGLITILSGKTDYVHPFKGGKFEAGLKSSLVNTDSDIAFYNVANDQELFDSTRSNHFLYKENINAAYANYAREFKKFDFQFGLRVEHTQTNGQQITTGQTFSRNYVYLFPSLFVNRKISDDHLLSFSYSRRIDRPTYRQLNPFRIFVDPYTYVVGDPQLRPVLTNSAESSYTLKSAYTFSVGYTKSKEVITDVFVQNDITRISYQTPANLQNFDQVYGSINIPFSIKNWMNTNITGSAYWNKYTSKFLGGDLLKTSFAFDVNVTNSFNMGKGWSAELSGYYQGQQAWGLFVIKNLAQVTAGIQKTTKNKMTTVKLSVSDIFYTNRIAVIIQYQNQDVHTSRTWDSRVLMISFIQRFGKNTVAQARKRNTSAEDVKSRAN